jgi:hypothetical protein
MRSRSAIILQRNLRSLVKRSAIPLAEASGSYAVQHLPEWMATAQFDFAYWRDLWIAQNPRNDRSDLARLVMFIENAGRILTESISGSIAELGVYKGTTAKLLHELLPERTLWLFDTFEGFDARDLTHKSDGTPSKVWFGDTSMEAVLRYIGPSARIRPCKGYFPATATSVPEDERFALVHIDADLAKPTHSALEYFYPRLSPGGFLILHDYGGGAWPGVAGAVDAFFADKPECLVRIPDRSGTAIVRRLKCVNAGAPPR